MQKSRLAGRSRRAAGSNWLSPGETLLAGRDLLGFPTSCDLLAS